MPEVETLAHALVGRSLARFGDGELKLALGRDAKSQRHDPDLAKALRAVLQDWSGPCLPCIPNIGPAGLKATPKAAFWKTYTRREYAGLYRQEGIYGSSFITRPDSAPWLAGTFYWNMVRELWTGRDVVLVRGSTKSLVAEELADAASVATIVAPRQHAWENQAELFRLLRREPRRVLLAIGATSTVLAHRLAHDGVHAVDVGHIGMFLRKAVRGEDATVVSAEDRT